MVRKLLLSAALTSAFLAVRLPVISVVAQWLVMLTPSAAARLTLCSFLALSSIGWLLAFGPALFVAALFAVDEEGAAGVLMPSSSNSLAENGTLPIRLAALGRKVLILLTMVAFVLPEPPLPEPTLASRSAERNLSK